MNLFFSVVKIFLYPFALIYGALVWLRNRLYDTGFISSVSFSVPVISVGNLSVGGTGKTPHVEYLVRLLQYRYQVATMSRGYKRRTQGFLLADAQTNALRIGDEPMQYHLKFPDLTVSVAEERMTGIPHLLQQRPDTDVILLDDAYQHRSVKAGLNILITDFTKPYYNDYILPYGRLREGKSAAKRADVIIVSKCPLELSTAQAQEIKRSVAPLPNQHVFFSGIRYDVPYDFFSKEPASLKGKNIILVCCIANPVPLVAYLEQSAAAVHVLSYPDHHYFLSKDLEEIRKAYDNWNVDNKIIVTTEKDAARLHLMQDTIRNWPVPVVVVPITIQFLLDQGAIFDQLVLDYIAKEISEQQDFPDDNAAQPYDLPEA